MKRTILKVLLACADSLAYALALLATSWILTLFRMQDNLTSLNQSGWLFNWLLPVVLLLTSFGFGGLYRLGPLAFHVELKRILKSVVVAGIIIHVLLYLFEIRTIKTSVTISLLVFMILSPLVHYYFRSSLFRAGLLRCRIAIVGQSEAGRRFEEQVSGSAFTTCQVVVRTPSVEALMPHLDSMKIDEVVLALENPSGQDYRKAMASLELKVPSIRIIPDNLYRVVTFAAELVDFNQILTIQSNQGLLSRPHQIGKRIFDIFASLVGLLCLIPLSIAIFIAVKLEDHGKVFFRQIRIGEGGEPIQIYKFRTMVPNAEKILDEWLETNPAIRSEYLTQKKLRNDPRITKVGALLRNTSLDEFPQFWNVLKGEMSLVGPRPYLYSEKDDMGEEYQSVIKVKPGITGLWQSGGRNELSFQERVDLDQYYIRNWTLWLDCVIVLQTVGIVLKGRGAKGL